MSSNFIVPGPTALGTGNVSDLYPFVAPSGVTYLLQDEFALSVLDPRWTQFQSTLVGGIDPTWKSTAAGEYRYDLNVRPSWVRFQATDDGGTARAGIFCSLPIVVGNPFTLWVRGSFSMRRVAVNNEPTVECGIATTSLGLPSTTVRQRLFFNESDTNTNWQWDDTAGTAPIDTSPNDFTSHVGFAEFVLQRLPGNLYQLFVGNGAGTYLLSTNGTEADRTIATAYDKFYFSIANLTQGDPGQAVGSLDFVRVIDGVYYP